MAKMKPQVNEELRDFLPAASDELKLELKDKIFRDGVLEPILVAEDYDIVDGYTRHALYKELGILKYPIKVVPDLNTLEDKKRWMRDHQIHRRNLGTVEWKYFWGMKFNEEKLTRGRPRQENPHGDGETADRLAKESGKSPASVERAGAFAAAMEKQPKSVRPTILAGLVTAELVILANGRPLFCDICVRRGVRRGCEQCKKKQDAITKPKKRKKKTASMFDGRPKELAKLHDELLAACDDLPELPAPTKVAVAEWRRRIGVCVEKIEHLLLETAPEPVVTEPTP